jgi:hypothetical protein
MPIVGRIQHLMLNFTPLPDEQQCLNLKKRKPEQKQSLTDRFRWPNRSTVCSSFFPLYSKTDSQQTCDLATRISSPPAPASCSARRAHQPPAENPGAKDINSITRAMIQVDPRFVQLWTSPGSTRLPNHEITNNLT